MSEPARVPLIDATAARLARFESLLDEVAEVLGPYDLDLEDAAVTTVNREFGRHLSPMAEAAADAVGACPEPFQELDLSEASIRAQEERVRFLQTAREGIDQLWQRANLAYHGARVDLAADVRSVLGVAEVTRDHPALPAARREAVALAVRALFALRDRRQADAPAAWHAGGLRGVGVPEDDEGKAEG